MPFGPENAPRRLDAPAPGLSLWWCVLDAPPSRIAALLSEAEHARMLRFGTDTLRTRYLIGRGTLRWLLGESLGIAPRDVAIVRGVRGRPHLADYPQVDFNITHTADRAMIGIAWRGRIGVDIERSDRILNAPGVARKFMSATERAALPVDADGARRQLLRLWTCKEALSKATGDALSAPFSRIELTLTPDPRLVAGPPPYNAPDWSLHAVDAPDDYLATVALWRRAPARA
jgi:4'-phosphopantetheinyl transferase